MSRRHHCPPPPPPLPSGYQPLNYIQSTGTQYINLNINVSSAKIEYQFRYSKAYSSNGGWSFLGGGNANDTNWTCNFYHYIMQLRLYVGTSGNIFNYNLSADVPYDVDCVVNPLNHTYDISFNGQRQYGSFNGSLSTYSPYLFSFNRGGTRVYNFAGKCWYLKMFYNDNVVRDLIPALRISDYKVGLYDLCGSICPLTNTPFYINAGSGDFLYG